MNSQKVGYKRGFLKLFGTLFYDKVKMIKWLFLSIVLPHATFSSTFGIRNPPQPGPAEGFLLKGKTMPRKLCDIIYILRENVDSEELRYSLRSLKNLPHRKVFFIGGQPKDLKPDVAVPHKQLGDCKWELIRSSMSKAVELDELTDDFFLFNDDFFVMKPFKGTFVNYIDKTLEDRIVELREVNRWLNQYGRTVLKVNEELKALGIWCPKNFEVHLPMLMNKELVKTSIYKCSSPQMRSIYGNINRIKTVQHTDVKVYDLETVPEDPDFLSTNDTTFREGKVGEYIREQFPEPSRFEV